MWCIIGLIAILIVIGGTMFSLNEKQSTPNRGIIDTRTAVINMGVNN